MSSLRRICVWITVIAVLLGGPAASLAECLRCPPDCPMHAPRAERETAGAGGGHVHHGHATTGRTPDAMQPDADLVGSHGDHAAHAGQPQAATGHVASAAGGTTKKCHDDAGRAPKPAEGPCLSGTCGHMDVSIARVLPEGVLSRPGSLEPMLVRLAPPSLPATRPSLLPAAPPTEPPRSLLA